MTSSSRFDDGPPAQSTGRGREVADDAWDTGPAVEDGLTVEASNLRKTFGDPDDEGVVAVDDVSFSVSRGEIVGLLGPNGAGKTTTIKMLLGLVTPTSGSATVAGVDVVSDPRKAYERVGAMLEGARNVYWRLSVRENLRFFAAVGGGDPAERRERHDELLDSLGLAEKANVTVNELSQGQKQKVSLACTLARGADVVFLDEPTLGLDVESSLDLQRELRRLAREEDVTVVVSSHDMDVVERVCDRVVVLADGRVVADERVDDLVELFARQAYRLRTSLEPGLREVVETAGTIESWEERDGTVQFEVVLPDQDAFYDLVDGVRRVDATLESLRSVDPDLEEAFVELTRRDSDDEGDDDDREWRSTGERAHVRQRGDGA